MNTYIIILYQVYLNTEYLISNPQFLFEYYLSKSQIFFLIRSLVTINNWTLNNAQILFTYYRSINSQVFSSILKYKIYQGL